MPESNVNSNLEKEDINKAGSSKQPTNAGKKQSFGIPAISIMNDSDLDDDFTISTNRRSFGMPTTEINNFDVDEEFKISKNKSEILIKVSYFL